MVKIIFFLRSGVFHAFANVLSTSDHLALSAYCFDFFFCGSGECCGANGKLLGNFAVTENLEAIVCLASKTCSYENLVIDNCAVLKAIERREIYSGIFLCESVLETSFRELSVKRDLTTLKAGAYTAA